MRRLLQILAAALAVLTVGLWAMNGANTGWTKNRVQVTVVDPVTEIPEARWEDKFMPGIDFLGIGLVGASTLIFGSFFIRKQNTQQQTQNS